MIDALIRFAVDRRWLVLAATLLVAAAGVYSTLKLPIDAVPDITNVQVQINSEAPGYSPLETEQRISYPVETAMAGLPKLDYTRSISRYGLSQVTVVFEEGTDIYWARQQISERLQKVRGGVPDGIEPTMGPIASGLGEIVNYVVRAKEGATNADGEAYTPEQLRTIQDWIIKPQLVKVPGVTEINSVGGYEKQYQVAPIPGRMLAYKVTMQDLLAALDLNNRNAGAGYIEKNGEQWLVRSPGQLKTLDDIRDVVVTKRDDAPVRVSDVAEVKLGEQLRTGASTSGESEVVLGTAMMLIGENSRIVAQNVANKIEEVQRSLPDGVVIETVYNRTSLVDKTIATVEKNLFEGAVLVIVVLFILLGNVRAALITACVIPLSMLFAVSGMVANKVSGNLMSLGAIDFGIIVDGAVIVVENALRRLGIAQQRLGRVLTTKERLIEVTHSTREVFNPAVFGVLIIMLVYLPIFALSGVEGKMFHPMAFTVVAALLGALIFSVTFVPAAIAIFVRGNIKHGENRIMRAARKVYQPVLRQTLKLPVVIILLGFGLFAVSMFQASRMGTEFLPQLDEGDIAMQALRIPGTGLQQSIAMQKDVESVVSRFDEVKLVFSKIGTPDVATDPMPPSVADTIIILKEREDWLNPEKTKEQLVAEIRTAVQELPGNKYEFIQPIEMRFNELIAGVRADLGVRIYGDDLQTLKRLGDSAAAVIRTVNGAADVRVEQMTGLSTLSVIPKRDHLALLGLTVADVQRAVQAAVGGVQSGIIYEGDKRFKLMVRLDKEWRKSIEQLKSLPIDLPAGNPELRYVPLGEVAELSLESGPNQINRESSKRNVIVSANVEDRDLGSFVADVQDALTTEVDLPAGYWVNYDGTFEQLQSASQRLSLVVPLALLLIIGLLYSAFNSLSSALVIFTGVPLGLTGGIFALALRDMPLSISAAVGFIALSGVAVLNGVVMLTFIRQLLRDGLPLKDAVFEGAQQRLRPVLMTALVASLGFVPMALNTGVGAEVQRPLATVVIGGIVSSTLLTLVVLPALYYLVQRFNGTAKA
ncbi:UNVERIFIED_ORG: cobalt-zinc-cadmium resistance protein CzcA [Idiomarina abyssalis]|jgi:cobalt-zinc-cadmium resistance protein CzcA|uniref:Metal efflux system membrane component (Silver efflux pump related) n=1 Tax=Idiomarina loihiensis (strain ATCC BAA-735 / DSM 15497 / L2-TR) TaxID=283942 RepID=Q5R0W3_IDILO|nr:MULTISPECIES: CusA/CzcA family heavy metal efflux RND transporter [Idiomarina]AAV82465.1 Metal efflux system membrane component (silver efflux pump related) [Idiomarina loihiensis L2TR]AGM36502.1 metal efflux system membrane protein [Idiomarina loihiensis GSL 199]TDO53903.1 cobalt-zinc-cadmium resistance protein CzcA [Idiomarina sp. 017G]